MTESNGESDPRRADEHRRRGADGATKMRPILGLTILLAGLTLARTAAAQCSANASSCLTCHEIRGECTVLEDAGPWHADHRFGDLCAACHAGDPTAMAKEPAHAGLRSPLAEPAVSCAGCHADDAETRARLYRFVMEVAAAPTTPAPAAASSVAPERPGADSPLMGLAIVLALALGFVLRGRAVSWRPVRAWTRGPHFAGALLGLVVGYTAIVVGRPLAASAAFDKLAAYPGQWLFPASQYYGHIMTPGITWQVWLMVGVLAGSFAASSSAGEARLRWLPDTQWRGRFGASRGRRLALAFGGAALVQLGAGIAGGCTSGLAISGGAVLAPGAFLFMAGMFAGGIPTAWAWYRGSEDA